MADGRPAVPTHKHRGEGCEVCVATDLVAEAGARVLLGHVGSDYDACNPHVQAHYKQIAADVMGAMSEALLDVGLVVQTGDDRG